MLSIHSGSPGTTANQLACNDDSGGPQSLITNLFVHAGQKYWIRISGKNGAAGNFQLLRDRSRVRRRWDCNGNGIPDECDIASGFSATAMTTAFRTSATSPAA